MIKNVIHYPLTPTSPDIIFGQQVYIYAERSVTDKLWQAGSKYNAGELAIYYSLDTYKMYMSLTDNNTTAPANSSGTTNINWRYLGDIVDNGNSRINTLAADKLDKVKTTASNRRVYGVSTSGEQTVFNVSQNTPGTGYIASYTANKTLKSSPAIANDDLVTKGQIDSLTASKLDKRTGSLTSRYVYSYYGNSQGAIQVASEDSPSSTWATPSQIPIYDSKSRLRSADPEKSYDVVNKHYGDASYVAKGSVSLDPTNDTLSIELFNKNNASLWAGQVVLPIGSVVVGGYFDDVEQEIVLTLRNGNEIRIPASALVSGLVSIETFQQAKTALELSIATKAPKGITIPVSTGGFDTNLRVNQSVDGDALVNSIIEAASTGAKVTLKAGDYYFNITSYMSTVQDSTSIKAFTCDSANLTPEDLYKVITDEGVLTAKPYDETVVFIYSSSTNKTVSLYNNDLSEIQQILNNISSLKELTDEHSASIEALIEENRVQALQIADLRNIVYDTIVEDERYTFENLDIANHPTHIQDSAGYHSVLPDGETQFYRIEGKGKKSLNLYRGSNPAFPANQQLHEVIDYLEAGKTYTVLLTGSGTYNVQLRRSDYSAVSYPLTGVSGTQQFTFTMTADTYYFFVYAGTEINLTVMLVEGSTALPYEPYFDGLKFTSVEGIKVNGQNLLDKSMADLTMSTNLNNWHIKQGHTYTFSFYSTYSTSRNFQFAFKVDGGSYVGLGPKNIINNATNSYTFTVPTNAVGVEFWINTTDFSGITRHQLNEGSTAPSTYTPYKEPFYISLTRVNAFADTGTKSMGTFTASYDKGKLTLQGLSMLSTVLTAGNVQLKAGTYNYKIWNDYGQVIGIYNVTADDWCSTVSSRNELEGTFTLAQDSTIAMGVQINASVNYTGQEIKYMVTKSSFKPTNFIEGNPDNSFDSIELRGHNYGDVIELRRQNNDLFSMVKVSKLGYFNFSARFLSRYDSAFIRPCVGGYQVGRDGLDFLPEDASGNISSGVADVPNTIVSNGDQAWGLTTSNVISFGWVSMNANGFTTKEQYRDFFTEHEVYAVYELRTPVETVLATDLDEAQVATLIEKYGSVEVVGNVNSEFVKPNVTMLYQVTKAIES